ncbi:MAG: GNAT family N-acyltransferase [Jannaschia sp.]
MEIEAGRWRARLTGMDGAGAALALRAAVFRGGAPDDDAFDEKARHLVIEGAAGIAACARVSIQVGPAILAGYAAQFYDLKAFSSAFPTALEVGRVCVAPGLMDPEVPRLLLAILARIVDRERLAVLHGCSSFPQAAAPLERLASRVAPATWGPGVKSRAAIPLTGVEGTLPPLLRSYLSLGARVSDHAVLDHDMGTVHVHTALPVADIPEVRARLLTGILAAV